MMEEGLIKVTQHKKYVGNSYKAAHYLQLSLEFTIHKRRLSWNQSSENNSEVLQDILITFFSIQYKG